MTVLRSGTASHVGRVRQVNQDLALVSSNLFAVADGMGGHAGGEVAAQVAVAALAARFGREPTAAGLRAAVADANRAVWQRSQLDPELRGMGTTLTAMALVGAPDGSDVLALANVGDSRAYLFSENRLTQVTADHSLAAEKVRHGEMTEAQAAVHPHRHILTRALGVTDQVEVDLWELRVRTGDRVLLCSDGLSNEVAPDEISEVLATVPDPAAAAGVLVARANEHGGSDNVTVVVVDVLVGEAETTAATPVGVTILAATHAPTASDGRSSARAAGMPGPGTDSPPGEGVPGTTGTFGGAGTGAGHGPGDRAGPPRPTSPPASTSPAAGFGRRTALDAPVEPDPLTAVVPRAAAGREPAAIPAAGNLRAASSAPAPDSSPVGATGGRGQAVGTGGGGRTGPTGGAQQGEPDRRRGRRARRSARRARRRQLGVPRRVTVRVVGFFLLLAGLLAAAFFVVRWYASDNWYVTVRHSELVIYQGRPGGLLWFEPKLVDRTGITTSQVPAFRIPQLRTGVQEPSLSAARAYVRNLHQQEESTTAPQSSVPGSTQAQPGAAPPATPGTTAAPAP
ncbi:MAG TPA: Stp1/IreP family PP2C-type Ser/Thr phosphatase [Acidimicrobiales bacterium]|nr:Stp1/IreP family PP2C-type Ser/Thr phosphatase [Acidimicrobiales bacterium]